MSLSSLTDVALVERACAWHAHVKEVGPELERRRPAGDEGASRLLDLYRSGEAPAWLTAYLLGCIGRPAGYETVLAILHEAPGLCAESYAGVAAVRISGRVALGDLESALRTASNMRTREGAAYGIAALEDSTLVPLLVDAFGDGRIRGLCAAGTLAGLLSAHQVETRLRVAYASERRLVLNAVFHALARNRGSELASAAPAVGRALRDPELSLSPLVRERLTSWVG